MPRFGADAGLLGVSPGRWAPAAQLVLDHAVKQAHELGHPSVGTEHALLGLLAVREGFAAQVLSDLGVTRQGALAELDGPCAPLADGCLGVMPRFKQALEAAQAVAGSLGHPVADTEHLLAGILAVPDALAVEILERQGVAQDAVRVALASRLGTDSGRLLLTRRRRRLLSAHR